MRAGLHMIRMNLGITCILQVLSSHSSGLESSSLVVYCFDWLLFVFPDLKSQRRFDLTFAGSASSCAAQAGRMLLLLRETTSCSRAVTVEVEPPLRTDGWTRPVAGAVLWRAPKTKEVDFIYLFVYFLFIYFWFSFWRRSKRMPWDVSMCSLLIPVLNNRRKRCRVGLGGVHLLGVEVQFAIISVSGLRRGPWSNWRRRCSPCPLGTGSETCCSGIGRPTTGKDAANCIVYARIEHRIRRASVHIEIASPCLQKYSAIVRVRLIILMSFVQVWMCWNILLPAAQLCCYGCCNRFTPCADATVCQYLEIS